MRHEPNYTADSDYHLSRRWIEPHTVRCLDAAFTLLGQPTSLVDMGCATGALVTWATYRGVDAVGVDLAAPEHPPFLRADLRYPLDLGRTFQWVLCWEVAEHLPEGAADILCQTLVRHMDPSGRVLFTAARPGQRGPGHINVQPPAYWTAKFAALGLAPAPGESRQLRETWLACAPRTPWYGRNAMVFWRVA